MKISYDLDLDRIKNFLQSNPTSPLFARFADLLAQKGKLDEAIKICENGINVHKFYVSAYIVLARLYFHKEDYDSALTVLNKVFKLSPDCLSAIKLKEKILLKKKEQNKESSIGKQDVLDNSLNRSHLNFRNDVEEILEKLNSAESLIIKADPNFDKFYKSEELKSEIASETLYRIYYEQGLYQKAIEVLQKLCERFPEKADMYKHKINSIEQRLRLM
ncbi:MAG: tetratricopeptide repeat protein [Ignavibacteria bacterium]|nr:tetratricopeptide repeat protein [Ignavibacteria bacterium]